MITHASKKLKMLTDDIREGIMAMRIEEADTCMFSRRDICSGPQREDRDKILRMIESHFSNLVGTLAPNIPWGADDPVFLCCQNMEFATDIGANSYADMKTFVNEHLAGSHMVAEMYYRADYKSFQCKLQVK
jgi:hypothetical protein